MGCFTDVKAYEFSYRACNVRAKERIYDPHALWVIYSAEEAKYILDSHRGILPPTDPDSSSTITVVYTSGNQYQKLEKIGFCEAIEDNFHLDKVTLVKDDIPSLQWALIYLQNPKRYRRLRIKRGMTW